MFLLPFQWCLAYIWGHSLELIFLSEIAKQIGEGEIAAEDGLREQTRWGGGLLGWRPLLLPNSKSITIMGSGAISGRTEGQEEPDVWTLSNPHSAAFYNVWSQAEKRHIWLRTEESGRNQPRLCSSFRGDSGPGSPRPHLAAGGVGLNGGPETRKERRGS